MHKCAFEGLKRTFMHVSGLPSPCFDLKTNYLRNWFFLSSYGGRRPETCMNVRFGPWHTRF